MVVFITKSSKPILKCKTSVIGMISHKKSLITIFGHKYKIKHFIKNLIFFMKKFKQPLILVHIWYEIANFEAKSHQK